MKRLYPALLAAALSLAPVSAAHAQSPTATPAAETTVDSYERFTVEVFGEGPDILFIPGLATPRDVWRPVTEGLNANFRVHLLQVRGFGEEAGINAEGEVLAPLVEEIASYIDEERLKSPAIVGHSMGGLAAMMIGARHPALPGSLLIVDALPWFGVLAGPAGASMSVADLEPRARMMRDTLASTYGNPADPAQVDASIAGQVLDEKHLPQLREWATSADPRVTAALLYDDLTTDMRQEIASIEAPMTVIYPFNETYPTREQADPLYRMQYAALQDVTYVAVGNSAHFVMLDQPEAFANALKEFLAAK